MDNPAVWFLCAGVVIMTFVAVGALFHIGNQVETLESRAKNFGEMQTSFQKQLKLMSEVVDGLANSGFEKRTDDVLGKACKEIDVLIARQRTLEKKFAEADRTLNVVFRGKVPVEHSNEPVIKVKKTPGRGKAALFHPA